TGDRAARDRAERGTHLPRGRRPRRALSLEGPERHARAEAGDARAEGDEGAAAEAVRAIDGVALTRRAESVAGVVEIALGALAEREEQARARGPRQPDAAEDPGPSGARGRRQRARGRRLRASGDRLGGLELHLGGGLIADAREGPRAGEDALAAPHFERVH